MSMIGINGRYGTQAQENTVTAQNSQSDYAKALQTKYDYLNAAANMNGVPTTVTVSSAFVAKCAKDPERPLGFGAGKLDWGEYQISSVACGEKTWIGNGTEIILPAMELPEGALVLTVVLKPKQE